ncbi:cyclic nucleotide-binding domain-containing protein [Oceanicoccus sagamiensis]|uniref:Cyclic nucleotide-binding domain-containing protein n=1 Tax=Oceanicoccus sagamiensis TaxID=716816 RepID=A0A1X9N9P2_9GAMM|nr:cyclic nucleotide-binding domain-containing protein [Oceanicoccus sagamiensis]ARN74780.1 hypothetical protein BST96_12010 [Oceanicoccus sagamiensis]
MKIKDLSAYQHDEISALLGNIPFFKELQTQGQEQLAVLMRHSCLVELEPGETIMRRGDRGSWLYFLIKGQLSVYLDEAEPLNTITPGELFGDLALLCNHERKATVAAQPGSKQCLLFATDFKPFGDLTNYGVIDLHTKLAFYRTMVHSIRWRLEVNRMEHPKHPLAAELRQVPTYSGEKGVEAELQSLFSQAQFLASVLDSWNSEGVALEDVMVASAANR